MKSLILFLIITPIVYCSANDQYIRFSIKELMEEIKKVGLSDHDRTDICNELSFKYKSENLDSANWYAQKALDLALPLNYLAGIGSAYLRLGQVARLKAEIEAAIFYYQKALDIRKKVGTKRQIASVYLSLGVLQNPIDADSAHFYFTKGLKVIESEPESIAHAKFYINLGGLYTTFGNFEQAYDHLQQALDILEKSDHQANLADAYLNLGYFYYKTNHFSRALNYFEQSKLLYTEVNNRAGIGKVYIQLGSTHFEEGNFREALSHYEEALTYEESLSVDDILIIKKNIASTHYELGEHEKADQLYWECLRELEAIKNEKELANVHYDIGYTHFRRSNLDSAIHYFQKALAQSRKIQAADLEIQTSFILADAYAQNDQFIEALRLKDQFIDTWDTLHQSSRIAYQLKADYEEAKKEKAQLNLEKKEKQQKTMMTYGIIGFLILILGLVVIALVAYSNSQKKQLAFMRIDELLIEKELVANYARLEEQEKERNRIAQDLHDRLGSMLSVVKLSLGTIEAKVTNLQEESQQQYQKVNALLDEACDEVRNISYNLKNSILAKFGLKAALESLVRSLEGGDLQVDLNIYNLDNRLQNEIEVNVYRIIQEAISNALKHAKATRLGIQLNRFEDLLNITIEDNGVGFDPAAAKSKTRGLGLSNMETRVYNLNGKINIDSGRGSGTTIMIDIPSATNLTNSHL